MLREPRDFSTSGGERASHGGKRKEGREKEGEEKVYVRTFKKDNMKNEEKGNKERREIN